MKTTKLFFIIAILCVFSSSYGDIIPDNSHYVSKCVKITNLDDYPKISLIGVVNGPIDYFNYLISDSICLYKGYKFNSFSIYAVDTTYLIDMNIEDLDIPAVISDIQIEPEGYYIHDSIPISSADQFYEILGFTDSTVVIFKWKEITGYNDGTPDSTQIFNYAGDLSSLSQDMPLNIDPAHFRSQIKLYPNPNKGDLILKMNNTFFGKVYVDIYSLSGQVAKSYQCNKTDNNGYFTIPTNDLIKGTYVIRLRFGERVESQKLVVN